MTAGFAVQVSAFALSFLFALFRLPDAIRGRNRSIFFCMVLIAVSTGLSLPLIYEFVDPLLGGFNLANLLLRYSLYGVFVILGLRGAAAFGAEWARRLIVGPVGLVVLGLTVVLTAAFFLASDIPVTSTGLLDYNDQVSVEVYGMLGRLYPAYVAACVCAPALAAARNSRYRLPHRIGSGLFGIGLAVVVLFTALTLVADIGVFMLLLPFSAVILVTLGLAVMWVSNRLQMRRPAGAARLRNVTKM
ncbi:hypothetical protein N9A08_00645 [Arthrobacter koreensis]|uniref:Uncharacterized protein n=1 Tax=Arthrobacter koreensis TaxID=199136 RepID=A0ABY6FSQ6_9MICC|nr:hypothetical protein [Arthrobacter koreensis]UYB36246.1 hypothetical protein N9A08_00645 [Arthrobacter koreensis]